MELYPVREPPLRGKEGDVRFGFQDSSQGNAILRLVTVDIT